MPNPQKTQKVSELKERIEGSSALFLADFRGLTVGDVGELRRALSPAGARFSVVKNTLMRRAAGDAGVEELNQYLVGPTAVAFVDGDAVTAAKSLVDALRRFRTMTIKGGYMEGRVLTPEEAQAIATIEPREVLLAKVAGAAKAHMARAAYMFQALQSQFLALLEAYREKLPPAGEATAAASEPQGSAEAVDEAGGPAEGEPVPAPDSEVEETAPEATVPSEALEEEADTEDVTTGSEPTGSEEGEES